MHENRFLRVMFWTCLDILSKTIHACMERKIDLIRKKYNEGYSVCRQLVNGPATKTTHFNLCLIFQVITLSKQQGLLHSPRSEDGGSIRYRALTDQDPSPPASTTGAVGGGVYSRSVTLYTH